MRRSPKIKKVIAEAVNFPLHLRQSPKEEKVSVHRTANFSQGFRRSPNFSVVIFLFNESKNSAVSELRTSHFRGLEGFKATDLSFKATAKEFKMCPRGQGGPPELHLWIFYNYNIKMLQGFLLSDLQNYEAITYGNLKKIKLLDNISHAMFHYRIARCTIFLQNTERDVG